MKRLQFEHRMRGPYRWHNDLIVLILLDQQRFINEIPVIACTSQELRTVEGSIYNSGSIPKCYHVVISLGLLVRTIEPLCRLLTNHIVDDLQVSEVLFPALLH